MKHKKALVMLMTAAMLAGTPAAVSVSTLAASRTTTVSVIDTTKKGSITIHKIINNDGYNSEADGMGHDTNGNGGITSMSGAHGTPIDKIGFSYKKIASIVDVADGKETGTYFTALDAGFASIAKSYGADMSGKTIGDTVYYTTDQVEKMLSAVNNVNDGEQKLNEYLKSSGTAMPLTNTAGAAAATNLDLGLYLFGETDITAHDGLDAKGTKIITEREAANPEQPIIESPASPFLVSLPTTNITTVDGNAAGTVWIYNEDVYPKNQTTEIAKRIVDPDETSNRTLRTSEDYQIGDTINQIIYADVPRLQPGKHHIKYIVSDTMSDSLTFDQVTKVVLGRKVANPKKESDFAGFTALTKGTDYTLTPEKGGHHFDVTFTATGLAKLDAVSGQSQVVVYFNATLNKAASIGTANPANVNYPSIKWKNSNTYDRDDDGNRVYDYTYELDLNKTGLVDASKSTFTVVRKDSKGKDTNVKWVEEKPGYYHVYDVNHGDTDATKAVEKINPTVDGVLNLKGFDSDSYTFKEIGTEQNKDLMKTTFTVTYEKKNDPNLNGEVNAYVTTPDQPARQPLTCLKGVAKLTVNNYKAITLHTGGTGRLTIYLAGFSAMAAVGVGAMVIGKKRKKEEEQQ